jgi:hypothetical protein
VADEQSCPDRPRHLGDADDDGDQLVTHLIPPFSCFSSAALCKTERNRSKDDQSSAAGSWHPGKTWAEDRARQARHTG